MAKKPRRKTRTTGRAFKTIKFVIYCFDKSKPGKEEGTMQMTDTRHKLVEGRPSQHFDSYEEIGPFVRRCMAERHAAPR